MENLKEKDIIKKDIDTNDKAEKFSNKDEKESAINEIKIDESLDMDTRDIAIESIKYFDDIASKNEAIKFAEIVCMLWTGEKRFEHTAGEIYFYKTKINSKIFVDKIFPIAKQYENIESIDDVPSDIIEDIKEFKYAFSEYFKIDEFRQNEETSELFDYVSRKVNELGKENLRMSTDKEWMDILDKMDSVGIDLNKIEERTKKFIEVWIAQALIDYREKKENIKERTENSSGVRGFENCEEISNNDVKEFLYKTFGKDLLAKALISEIMYSSKFVVMDKEKKTYNYMEEAEYLKLKDEVGDDIENIKIRGMAESGEHYDKISTIVNIYNHKYEDLSKYTYLYNYDEDKKLKAYILGTISHEVGGHHFFNKILKLSEQKEYEEICKIENSEKNVTLYVKKHKEKILIGNIYHEDFSESIRRFLSDYENFKEEFPKRAKFIENKFPDITKNGIKEYIE